MEAATLGGAEISAPSVEQHPGTDPARISLGEYMEACKRVSFPLFGDIDIAEAMLKKSGLMVHNEVKIKQSEADRKRHQNIYSLWTENIGTIRRFRRQPAPKSRTWLDVAETLQAIRQSGNADPVMEHAFMPTIQEHIVFQDKKSELMGLFFFIFPINS